MEINEKEIIGEYLAGGTINALSAKYHIGKIKFREILRKNGVDIKKSGGQKTLDKSRYVVKDWRIEKYPEEEGYEYVAIDMLTGFETRDYMNQAGVLTSMIKKNGVEIPTLYDRRKYYMETGNYWWEQWFRIERRRKAETKKCPYCGWETIDVENKSGVFMQHIEKEHGITPEEHLKNYPEDERYFKKIIRDEERDENLKIQGNYVKCPICGKKMKKITESHLLSEHGLTVNDFKERFLNNRILSDTMLDQIKEIQKVSNLHVSKNRFVSSYEKELQELLDKHDIKYEANRQILEGREIDILIPEKRIGIEFDGLKWHTEWFGGKEHDYHLSKTDLCNKHGYGLIHIFEDEYVNNKELVKKKLLHILGLSGKCEKIMARKCKVSRIDKNAAREFLNKNHIQGYASSSVYYGAFYNDRLVAVMSFRKANKKDMTWELNRFASDNDAICQGIGGKLFKKFIREYNPERVISFADRRWTQDIHDNIYTKLGFFIEEILPPNYSYYNEKKDKYKRIHKSCFRKEKLHKKYGFPMTMTEKEMAKELGYDRIWDCGLVRYAWYNGLDA